MSAVGYYNQTPNGRQRPSRFGAFAAGLGGVVVGALLVWILFYTLPELRPDNGTTSETQIIEQGAKEDAEAVSVNIMTDVTKAVDIAADAVVGVSNLQANGDFWSQSEQQEQAVGTGSGVIYKNDNGTAYVVTNHHVIDGASGIEVTLSDGSKVQAELVGSDIWTDLAVLEMDGAKVQAV
ncbi:MAG: S1C family serine protease, partial [Planococcus donghaensis]